jgi:hypothetical protein
VEILVLTDTQSARISAPKPDCLNATYLSDTAVLPMTSGSSQTVVEVGYGMCAANVDMPFHVLTINYFANSATAPCCLYKITFAENTDCAGNVDTAVGLSNVINPNGTCSCEAGSDCSTLPVEAATWGSIKALYRH